MVGWTAFRPDSLPIRSKLIAYVEVDVSLITAAIFLNRNTVINAQWANWQVETQASPNVRGEVIVAIPVVRINVQNAGVVKYCGPDVLDDRKTQLGSSAG